VSKIGRLLPVIIIVVIFLVQILRAILAQRQKPQPPREPPEPADEHRDSYAAPPSDVERYLQSIGIQVERRAPQQRPAPRPGPQPPQRATVVHGARDEEVEILLLDEDDEQGPQRSIRPGRPAAARPRPEPFPRFQQAHATARRPAAPISPAPYVRVTQQRQPPPPTARPAAPHKRRPAAKAAPPKPPQPVAATPPRPRPASPPEEPARPIGTLPIIGARPRPADLRRAIILAEIVRRPDLSKLPCDRQLF